MRINILFFFVIIGFYRCLPRTHWPVERRTRSCLRRFEPISPPHHHQCHITVTFGVGVTALTYWPMEMDLESSCLTYLPDLPTRPIHLDWPTHLTHPPGRTFLPDSSTWSYSVLTWHTSLNTHLIIWLLIIDQFPIWPTWYAIGLEQFRNIHKTFFSQFNIGSIDGSVKIIFQVETAQLAAHRWKIKHGQWWWWWLCLLWWLC